MEVSNPIPVRRWQVALGTMKATLIYNANARSTDTHTVDDLQEGLLAAGYEPVYTPTEAEDDLNEALRLADGGLVVAAGGDGTVRAVALRLMGRPAGLAVLPLGTANNIARTFGIEGDPLQLIAGLAQPRKCPFDIGHVQTPWGDDYFLEAMGVGFYADTLAAYGADGQKSVLRAIRAFTQTLPSYHSKPFSMTLDGADISGDYLFVEVLNTPAFGPRLKVAPSADPGDGLFEVIRIREAERQGFLAYIAGLFSEELHEVPGVESAQGRRLELKWFGFPMHIDGILHPNVRERPSARKRREGADAQTITVEVIPSALQLWLPTLAQQDG
jgi:diacylglycerol kinase (ATP)